MRKDPVVEEVRSVRERLAAEFGFDVHAIFEDLRKRQSELGDRLVQRKRTSAAPAGREPVTPISSR